MRRTAPPLLVVLSVLAVLVFPHGASAQTDAERERDRVRAEQADAAANIDVLQADKSEIDAALQTLNDRLNTEEEALANAEREVAAAEAAGRRAQAGIDEATANLTALEDQLRLQMIEAYTDPNGDTLASVLDAESATDIVKRRAILRGQNSEDEDLADQVTAARDELQAQRRAAAAARQRAEETRAEVETRVQRVQDARDQQQTLIDAVQQRINAQVARSVELGNQDRALSAQIAEEQAQLQAQLAILQYQRQQQQQAAAAPAPSGPTYGDGGSENAPVATPGGGGVTPNGSGTGGIPLCNASGITVNCAIAENVRAMIAAAAAAGVTLTGSGYRDPARQIALREQHCGSSYYAIYQMPSSQCHPPTARPGSSQHEVGLAIDFSQYSYSWLAANAASFGFYNLPSESWHWSTTGS